jgi:DNA-binding IclR family transcriptional regulator
VGITAPTARMTKRRLNGCRAAVRDAAQQLEEVLA